MDKKISTFISNNKDKIKVLVVLALLLVLFNKYVKPLFYIILVAVSFHTIWGFFVVLNGGDNIPFKVVVVITLLGKLLYTAGKKM